MPNRYERNTAVLLKLEAGGYGVDAAPVPATDAILLRKFTCDDEFKFVNNPEVRPYFGKAKDLVANHHVIGSFEVALAGSGALGTPAPWGKILRCGSFAEAITALTRVDYTLISSALESATMYYYDDGTLKKALGLRVNINSIKWVYGDVPVLACSFIALDGGTTAVVPPAVVLTSWAQPLPVNQVNSGLLTIGCTYAAGALVGGATFPSKGIEISLGTQLNFIELLGGESADITDRDVTGKITVDLTAAQEISNMGIIQAAATQGIGFVHGTVAGSKQVIHLPNMQLKKPKKDVLNGKRVITYDFSGLPTLGTGNDEVRIVMI
jgi:hypothetical protein